MAATNPLEHDWKTCPCDDCALDRYIDLMDHRCTCCERAECVCPTDRCARCAMSEGVR